MLTPTVRRTWAPRGSKPILDCWDRRDRISAISGLTVSPRSRRPNLIFDLLPDNTNITAQDVADFLAPLQPQFQNGHTLLWHGTKLHSRPGPGRAFLRRDPRVRARTI